MPGGHSSPAGRSGTSAAAAAARPARPAGAGSGGARRAAAPAWRQRAGPSARRAHDAKRDGRRDRMHRDLRGQCRADARCIATQFVHSKSKVPPQRAVSRILFPPSPVAPCGARATADDNHSSRPGIAGGLERPTRRLRTGRPLHHALARALVASLFGLAPCGVLPAICLTADAVRSYRTFSPLPFALLARLRAGLGSGRYIFCATVLRVAPTGSYPAHCPVEFGLSSLRLRAALRRASARRRSSGPLRRNDR